MEGLQEKEWRPITLEEVFEIRAGKRLENRNKIEGNRPFIGATDNNNGVTGFVANENSSLDKNTLGVNYNGAPCIAFYHPYECIFTDDVKHLHFTEHEDTQEAFLAFISIFAKQRCKYNYGYKFNENRMLRQKLFVPIKENGKPDYDFMEQYVSEKIDTFLARYKAFLEKQIEGLEFKDIPALSEKEWKPIKAFGDDAPFEIKTTASSIDGINLIDDENAKVIPYITRTDSNNGVSKFVSKVNMEKGFDEAGCITVGLDTQTAFYQTHDFVTGQNIQIVTSKHLNKYTAMFLVPIFKKQMVAKFNWGGNGATLGRMIKLQMMLPTTEEGKPDWNYMEQYAKNLMLKKYQQYLEFLEGHSLG